MIGEPAPSPGDLQFAAFGIPVRIHPFFWLMAALLGYGSTGGQPRLMFFWILAVLISVFVHEMGHALVIRHFGWQPRVTLYGMGGLASYNAVRMDPRTHIVISLAGPLAGFALAALIVGALKTAGSPVHFTFGWPHIVHWELGGFSNRLLHDFTNYMLFANIWWGLLNMLPIWPLDGGQITRDLFQISSQPNGLQNSLWLSVFTAGAVAIFAFTQRDDKYMAFFFGYMAYQNYMLLQGYVGGFRGRR